MIEVVVTILIVGLTVFFWWAKDNKTGLKAYLCSTIAYEASSYLDVDANAIEESLLKDSKIVLHNAKVKPYVVDLGSHKMTVTGAIDVIEFDWAWTIPHLQRKIDFTSASPHVSAGVVKDTIVTMNGMKLKAVFSDNKKGNESTAGGSVEAPEEAEGRAYAFMWKQVRNFIDVLTLDIVDFELTMEMAVTNEPPKQDDNSNPGRILSVVIGSESIQLESFGRDNDHHHHDADLEQRLTIESLVGTVNASETSSSKNVEYPLMDPFSYSTRISRVSGTRFDGLFTGLNVDGHESSANTVPTRGAANGIVIHAGVVQTHALVQLYGLTTNGDDQAKASGTLQPSNDGGTKKAAKDDGGATDASSLFRVPISSVTILNMDESTIIAGSLDITYKADATVFNLEVKDFERDTQDQSVSATVSGIHLCVYPTLKLVVDSVDSLDLPDAFHLTKALTDSTAIFEDDTLCIKLSSIEGMRVVPENESNEGTEHKDKKPSWWKKHSTTRKHFKRKHHSNKGSGIAIDTERDQDVAPQTTTLIAHPVRLSVEGISVKTESDGSVVSFGDISFDGKPDLSTVDADARVHFHLGHCDSDLLKLKGTNTSALLNRADPTTLHDFKFGAQGICVVSGYSLQQWHDTLQTFLNLHYYIMLIKPPNEWQLATKMNAIKLPFAEIESLEIHVAIKGTGVDVKDTVVNIDAFHGNAETTSKDLVRFIMEAIARRVPKFITNADVLGVNVVRQGGAMAGADAMADGFAADAIADGIDAADATALAGAAGGAAGAAGGVGVVAAIDAAEAAVSLGKKSRGATPDQRYKPGDLTRGLIHAPAALAEAGARRRGNKGETRKDASGKHGKSFKKDVAVGAIYGAEQYVVHNKKQLAIAGVGGAGVIFGSAIGGPAGGIVIGLSASLGTAVAIDLIDRVKKKASKKMDEDLSKSKSDDKVPALSDDNSIAAT